MLNCRSVSLLILQSQHQALSSLEKVAVFVHLLFCRACRRFAKQSQFLHEVCQHLEQGHTHAKLSDQAKQRIKQALHDQE